MNWISQINWPAFLFAMAIIELTPGPNMGWLTALSAQHGRKAGFGAVMGITMGLSGQMLAATTGLAALLATAPFLFGTLKWAGVLYMLYLAAMTYLESSENAPAEIGHGVGFRRGLIANLLNPKALVFYVVGVGQFIIADAISPWIQILVLGSIHILIAFTVHAAIVLFASHLGMRLDEARTSLPVRLVFSGSLALVALWIALR